MTSPTPEEFEKIKTEAESYYRTIDSAHSPYFGGPVSFNAKGLDHLKFKEWDKARSVDDQCRRLRLINLAPEVMKLSRTVQGISYVEKFERRKTNSRWEKIMIQATYFEFIAVLKNVRVRVIIKQLTGGQPYFWSIMPFWREGANGRRKMSYGNPETD